MRGDGLFIVIEKGQNQLKNTDYGHNDDSP